MFNQVQDEAVRISSIISENMGNAFQSYNHLRFLSLALAGEVGELGNLVKKHWRVNGEMSVEEYDKWLAATREEVVDCFIYLLNIARNLDVNLLPAAMWKLEKVAKKEWAQPKEK